LVGGGLTTSRKYIIVIRLIYLNQMLNKLKHYIFIIIFIPLAALPFFANAYSTVLPPLVTISANPTTITYPGSSIITWNSQNASSCWGSSAWTGTMAPSGTVSVNPSQTATYTIHCVNVNGAQSSASAVITVNQTQPQPQSVINPNPNPQILPSVYVTANPQTLSSGNATLISWSSSNAFSCFGIGGLAGSLPMTGNQQVNVYQTTTYGVNCSNFYGSNSSQVTVSVSSAPVYNSYPFPTVSLSATPLTITAGNSVLLVWNSSSASACSASGGWSGSKAVSGSELVMPAVNTTYSISCIGVAGTVSDSKFVTVNPIVIQTVSAPTPPVATVIRPAVAAVTPSFTRTVVNLRPVQTALAAGKCDLNQCLNDKDFSEVNLVSRNLDYGKRFLAAIFIGDNGDISWLAYIFAVLFIIMFAIIVSLLRKLNKQKRIQIAL